MKSNFLTLKLGILLNFKLNISAEIINIKKLKLNKFIYPIVIIYNNIKLFYIIILSIEL